MLVKIKKSAKGNFDCFVGRVKMIDFEQQHDAQKWLDDFVNEYRDATVSEFSELQPTDAGIVAEPYSLDETLDEFVSDIMIRAKLFRIAYDIKHEQNPEQYPRSLPKNSGLWLEFFLNYLNTVEA